MLDACIKEDPLSRVACGKNKSLVLFSSAFRKSIIKFSFLLETCAKTGMVMIFGEITTSANVNYELVSVFILNLFIFFVNILITLYFYFFNRSFVRH